MYKTLTSSIDNFTKHVKKIYKPPVSLTRKNQSYIITQNL